MAVAWKRRAAACLVAATLLASAIGAAGCGTLGRAELTRGVESLGALAAQGQLLAGGVAQDRTKLTYTRVMARTLGEQAQHEAEKLADAEPQAGYDRARRAAVGLAGDLADSFSTLQTFAGDEPDGRAVLRQMERAQARSERIVAAIEEIPE